MILSDERQAHLAHLATDKVWGDDIADFSDDDIALRAAKKAIADFVKEDAEIDKKSARESGLAETGCSRRHARMGYSVQKIL